MREEGGEGHRRRGERQEEERSERGMKMWRKKRKGCEKEQRKEIALMIKGEGECITEINASY